MKKLRFALCLGLLVIFPTIVLAGPQLPDWANPVFESLGCMPAMVAEVEGEIVVTGIATDVRKLEAHGFTVFAGSPHRIQVSEIKPGLYKVIVGTMQKEGRNQAKELKLP